MTSPAAAARLAPELDNSKRGPNARPRRIGTIPQIVVPHVDTVEVAEQMVSACRYPPVGHRSVTGALPQIDFDPGFAQKLGHRKLHSSKRALNARSRRWQIFKARTEKFSPIFIVKRLAVRDLGRDLRIPGRAELRLAKD